MEINETVWLVLQVVGLIFAIFLTVWTATTLVKWQGSLERRWLALDNALAPFGQSSYGRAAYSAYQQARSQVDQPTDPLIQKFMALGFMKELKERKIITPEQLSAAATFLLDLGGELLDGEVDATLPPMPFPGAKPPNAPAS